MDPKIVWLGHASFRIESEMGIVYVDPWKLKDGRKADIILVTHSHHDHLSEEDIGNISKEGTKILGPDDVSEKFPGARTVKPGESVNIEDIKIEVHPAYNVDKEFHPRSNMWVGYVLDLGGFRIYHSGDTDVIPEMRDLRDIDVALLPVGGTYTMGPKEAAKALEMFKPKKAIPMHWGDIVGDRNSAEEFKRYAPCEVEVPKQEN